MISVLFLGLLFGIGASIAQREFSTRELVGFAILGVSGSLYGNFLGTMLSSYLTNSEMFLVPLFVVGMSLLFIGIKSILLHRQKQVTSQE